jgi:hypothetical protein
LALGQEGKVLVVHEVITTNNDDNQPVLATEVDVRTGSSKASELLPKAPWQDIDAMATFLNSQWKRPPLSNSSGVKIDVEYYYRYRVYLLP